MPESVDRGEKIVVSFDRIGPRTKVPPLVVPSMPLFSLRECIRVYAGHSLNGSVPQVHIDGSGRGGTLSLGNDSGVRPCSPGARASKARGPRKGQGARR